MPPAVLKNTARLAFVLPHELRDELRAYALREDLSEGQVMRKALREFFKAEPGHARNGASEHR